MLSTLPALSLPAGAPGDIALIADGDHLTYGELAARVDDRRRLLGDGRRLVLLAATNTVDSVVTYLAALEGGHPVLLAAPGEDEAAARHRAALIDLFDPDVVAGVSADAPLEARRDGSVHSFAPELALLASTSGSTGSPKLVRLSHQNLLSNAQAIAEYLQLSPADRAPTALPMHYCYGLSVINSHLVAGAGLVLTERSVTDAGFWSDAEAHRITSLAGVPHTYELLEAGRLTERLPSSIRYLTQAGGRLEPERVRRFARAGRRRGFDFVVMYGQTEATARMAFVPPQLAEEAAGAIGRPIPGGRLHVDAAPGQDVGELIYTGPNVMLGYAESPADLALGRTVRELRTGDLARQRDDGLFEIVGRLNRFVKVYGLRVDLDAVQRLLAAEGIESRAAGRDERLLVFVLAERHVAAAKRRAAALLGIPPHAVDVLAVAEFPRTSTGKPDYAALVRHAAQLDDRAAEGGAGGGVGDRPGPVTAQNVQALFAELLGRPDATVDDSFASLGGDSLSFVEVSLQLQSLLGSLPRDWPSRSARALVEEERDAAARPSAPDAGGSPSLTPPTTAKLKRRALPVVDTPAALRAVAILLVVATHADLIELQGGAHLLLAVVGYNLARFQLADVPNTARVRRLLRSAAQIALPAALWIGTVGFVTGKYEPTTALLLTNAVHGGGRWSEQWQFWFLEAVVWPLLALALLFAVRSVDRLERRHPWLFGVALLAGALALRYWLVGVEAGPLERYSAMVVLWFLVLGWVIARAGTATRRALASVAAIVGTAGFFGDPLREAVVVSGILLLVWVPNLALPRPAVPLVRLLAGASLFIYLTHWVVYPEWETSAPWLGTLLSLVAGIAAWACYRRATAAAGALRARLRSGVQSA